MQVDRKSPTILTSSRDKAEFLHNLQSLGISSESIFDVLGVDRSKTTLLLTGSLVQGMATGASDVDLICLSAAPYEPGGVSGDIVWKAGAGLSDFTLKLYRSGAELDVELYTSSSLSTLMGSTESLFHFMKGPEKRDSIPVLEFHELKFLHDIRTAWVLWNPVEYEKWLSALHAAYLPTYCIVNSLMESSEYLEDAFSNEEGQSIETVQVMARMSARHLCAALLASQGETNPNEKWLIPLLQRTAAKQPELASLISQGVTLLFPQGVVDRSEMRRYVRAVNDYRREVEQHTATDETVLNLLAYLRSRVSHTIDG